MVKLVGAFHLAALCLNAGLIVSGNAPGMLAQASLAIPADPNMQPIPEMRDRVSGSWSGTVTVLGGSGSGFLYFNMMAFGESFGGSPSSEYMDSYAGITSTVGSVASQPWPPQGSTPASCQFCGLNFTYGVPQPLEFNAYAYVSYTFYPMLPNVPPRLAGAGIGAAASVGPGWIAGADPARDFSIVFVSDAADPVSEPESWWLGALGLVSARLAYARTRLAVR
jgi:hypothetical protein